MESKYIRASCLNSLSDKRELFYAYNLINLNHEEFHEVKKKSFVVCFTPLPKGGKVSSLDYHWDNYGNKRRGLAFEFEVLRKPVYFYSLNVNYLDSNEQNNFL